MSSAGSGTMASLLGFDTMFALLKNFYEKHGHCRVPPVGEGGENGLLFSWTEQQRARILSLSTGNLEEDIDHIARLDSIGFWSTLETPTPGSRGHGDETRVQHDRNNNHGISIKQEEGPGETLNGFTSTTAIPSPSPPTIGNPKGHHTFPSPTRAARIVEPSPLICRATRQEPNQQQPAFQNNSAFPVPAFSPTTDKDTTPNFHRQETAECLPTETTANTTTTMEDEFTEAGEIVQPNKEHDLVESLQKARRVSELVNTSSSSVYDSAKLHRKEDDSTYRSANTPSTPKPREEDNKRLANDCPVATPIPKKPRGSTTQSDFPEKASPEAALFDLEPLPAFNDRNWMFERMRMARGYKRCERWERGSECRFGVKCVHAHVFRRGERFESMLMPSAFDLQVLRRVNCRGTMFYTAGYRKGSHFVYAQGGSGRSCPLGIYWYNTEADAKSTLLESLSENIVCRSVPDRETGKTQTLPALHHDWLFDYVKHGFTQRCTFFRPGRWCKYKRGATGRCFKGHVYSPGTTVHDIHYKEENLKVVSRVDAMGNYWYTAGYVDRDQSTFFYASDGKDSVKCSERGIYWYRDPSGARASVLSVLQTTGCFYGYDSHSIQHRDFTTKEDPTLL